MSETTNQKNKMLLKFSREKEVNRENGKKKKSC